MSNDNYKSDLQLLQAEVEQLRSALVYAEAEQLKLAEKEQFFRNLVELAADTILMGDHIGNIVGMNHSATNLTGYPRAELIGQNISTLFSEEARQKSPLRYDLLQQGQFVQTERELTRKNGTILPVSMNSKMMPDGTYHTMIRDITIQKNLEKKLRMANKELESFVYTVSHDLRTPLTPILGFSEILCESYADVLDEQGLLLLRSIEQAGTDMLELLEDLLLFASIGRLERPDVAVSTRQVVADVVRQLETEIQAADMFIQLDHLPLIRIPKTLLTQIFNNLLANAVRYAGESNRLVEVGGEQNGELIRYYVRDHGPGIAEQDREAVFDVFYRGASAQAIKGSGLGLAIVQKIVRTYGGDVWYEETRGGGCTIWLEMKTAS